ncbi:hypothetical protein [Chitinibacter mangrovi]|uniref:hypothetical protein n=1 Tax=Chitinibacter mangrovi TaxID=3153927 RepID=UPI003D81284C
MTLRALKHQKYDLGTLRSKKLGRVCCTRCTKNGFHFYGLHQLLVKHAQLGWDSPLLRIGALQTLQSNGSDEELFQTFTHVQSQIANRIRLFLSLPIDKIDRMSLQTKLRGAETNPISRENKLASVQCDALAQNPAAGAPMNVFERYQPFGCFFALLRALDWGSCCLTYFKPLAGWSLHRLTYLWAS